MRNRQFRSLLPQSGSPSPKGFALTLERMDQMSLPIPANIMRRIAARSGFNPLAPHMSGTIR